MKAYIVYIEYQNDGEVRISSRGYKTLENAKQYVETRPDKPSRASLGYEWVWVTEDGKKRYCITDIEIV